MGNLFVRSGASVSSVGERVADVAASAARDRVADAITMRPRCATSPAGIPWDTSRPPNQLTRMMAKQTRPICRRHVHLQTPGRIAYERHGYAGEPAEHAARGVTFRM